MGLRNKRKNNRNLFDLEQVPAIFSYPKCERAKPPLSLRAISPRGERD